MDPEPLIEYLAQFDGETGRHKLNQQDCLNMLYSHAVQRFNLPKNPLKDLERPLVSKKPIKTLSLEQVRLLNKTPQTLLERIALDLLLGHGWRQIEVRRVLVKDIEAIDNGLILCRGKERQELTPILPETVARLKEISADLPLDNHIFVARQTRHGHKAPLGEDGMLQLIERLLKRAEIKGFRGHDLRRTFATLVNIASGDEYLAIRLLRDSVPGLSNRYIRYPVEHLVEALQKYSPLRQAGAENTHLKTEAEEKNNLTITTLSPVSKRGENGETKVIAPENRLVETGEG